jgi:molybdopterin converting factor small subunit
VSVKRLKVKVLYFGPARDATGSAEEFVLLANPAFLQDLVSEVLKNHEDLDKMKITLKVAVNKEVVGTNVELHHGDEIAFLPAVAGG